MSESLKKSNVSSSLADYDRGSMLETFLFAILFILVFSIVARADEVPTQTAAPAASPATPVVTDPPTNDEIEQTRAAFMAEYQKYKAFSNTQADLYTKLTAAEDLRSLINARIATASVQFPNLASILSVVTGPKDAAHKTAWSIMVELTNNLSGLDPDKAMPLPDAILNAFQQSQAVVENTMTAVFGDKGVCTVTPDAAAPTAPASSTITLGAGLATQVQPSLGFTVSCDDSAEGQQKKILVELDTLLVQAVQLASDVLSTDKLILQQESVVLALLKKLQQEQSAAAAAAPSAPVNQPAAPTQPAPAQPSTTTDAPSAAATSSAATVRLVRAARTLKMSRAK